MQAGPPVQQPGVPSGAALLVLKPNVGEAVWWQVPCRPASHGMMSQWDTHSDSSRSTQCPWTTVSGEAWVTPGLLSPTLCCAGAVLLPGGGRRLWQSIGDTA